MYRFEWNSRGNLEGYEIASDEHRFTWQPSGSQFTIIEKIPQKRVHLKVKRPAPLDKEEVLKTLKFDKTWYDIVSTEIETD